MTEQNGLTRTLVQDNENKETVHVELSVKANWDIEVKIDGKPVPRQEGNIKYGCDVTLTCSELTQVFDSAIDAVADKAKKAAKRIKK